MSKIISILIILSLIFACNKSNLNNTLHGKWAFSFYVNAQGGYSEQSDGEITFCDPRSGTYIDFANEIHANFNWSLHESILLIIFENGSEYQFKQEYSSDLQNVFIQEINQERDSLILIRSN